MTVLATTFENPSRSGRFHWTVDTFYRAASAGIFDDAKSYELVNGELWKKEDVNPPHAIATEEIARLFRSLFEPVFWVREEKPLHIAFDGEPVPDIQVVAATARHTGRHATSEEAFLIVEIADTSFQRDTTEKALLYAQTGIMDYWVSVIPTRELLVFRNPTPDGYPTPQRLTENDTIRPLVVPGIEIAVRDLLARPEATPTGE